MSTEADALLQGAGERVAPEHILVEVGNTLLRVYRSGGMTLDHMQWSIESLGRLVQLIPTRDEAGRDVDHRGQAAVTQLQATRWSDRTRMLGSESDP